MKFQTVSCAIVLAIVAFLFIYSLTLPSLRRTEECCVIDLGDNKVTIVSSNGNTWAFDTVADYFIGERVIVTFDTRGTDTLFDDKIISVERN